MPSLTDIWHGFYAYTGTARPDNSFVASVMDVQGVLGGAVSERHPGPELVGLPLSAAIEGLREDCRVAFTKTYRPVPALPRYDEVWYEGVLSPDEQEVEGTWRIGKSSGRFLMIRSNRPLLAIRQRAAEWADHQT